MLTATDAQRWLVSCYFALTTMVTIGERPPAQPPAGRQRGQHISTSCRRPLPGACYVVVLLVLLTPSSHPVFSPLSFPPLPSLPSGYGDITPVTIRETGVTIFFEVVGGGWQAGELLGRLRGHV